MTDRERWTIYPLLFLALGLATRAVLVPPGEVGELEAVRMVCREIVVQDEGGRVMLHFGRVAGGGGRIEINDSDGDALMSIGSTPPEPSTAAAPGEGPRPPAVIEFAAPDGEVIRRISTDGGQTDGGQ